MLYLTTRSKFDTYTGYRALREDRAPNGGLYLPFRMPSLTEQEIGELKNGTFGQTMAQMLNLLFGCKLTDRDVEFVIGRYPAKLTAMSQRIWVGELWHNQNNHFDHLERCICGRICEDVIGKEIPNWMKTGTRIAALFSVYGEMLRTKSLEAGVSFDVALPTGDFNWVMAAWYARQMGLPVENIVCGCNENSAVWELLHIGEFRTDAALVESSTPDADVVVPAALERLICATLGAEETVRYCEICEAGGVYAPPTGELETLRKGMYGAVVSSARLQNLIPSVYRTGGYIMGPYTGLAYGGLQDYRAKTGTNRVALLIADRSPVCDSRTVCAAMGITEKELKNKLDLA